MAMRLLMKGASLLEFNIGRLLLFIGDARGISYLGYILKHYFGAHSKLLCKL